MRSLLAVDFSTGIAAVLLGAAAIILIVMIVEAVGAVLAQKAKSKAAKTKRKECAAVQAEENPPMQQTVNKEYSPSYAQPELPSETPVCEQSPATEEECVKPPECPQALPTEKPSKKSNIHPSDGGRTVYDKSFTARLILSDDGIKSSYSALKNELLKSGFQSRVCWRYESFRADKPLAAKLVIRGGGLCLFCALDPENFPQAEDVSDKKTYKRTPLLCLVSDSEKEEFSKTLIYGLAQKFQTETAELEEYDFAKDLPLEEMQTLLKKGFVKVKIYRKKTAPKNKKTKPRTNEKTAAKNEVKTAKKTVVKTPRKPKVKSVEKRDKKSLKKIVNLDVIYACFQEGETATYQEIINRVFNGNKNITYIKILGRGKADKNITVTANDFSRAAEKNILNAGGKIIRKNS